MKTKEILISLAANLSSKIIRVYSGNQRQWWEAKWWRSLGYQGGRDAS